MAELISMVEFVLRQYEEIQNSCVFETNCFKYATLLKQPLEIWMFVPCKFVDGVWTTLEKPIMFYSEENMKRLKGIEIEIANSSNNRVKEYQQAKSLCLFEGFELIDDKQNTWVFKFKNETWFIQKDETIEFLTDMEIALTPAAEKQIGL